MQFDPNASLSNDFSYEKSREVIRDMKEKRSGSNSSSKQTKHELVQEEEKEVDDEEKDNNEGVKEVLDESIVSGLNVCLLTSLDLKSYLDYRTLCKHSLRHSISS